MKKEEEEEETTLYETKASENHEISFKQCPICFTSFPSAVPTLSSIHLTRHFEDEIKSLLGEDKLCCPKCSQTFDKEDLTILHLGIEHDLTSEKLVAWKKKQSLKIHLKVDSALTCIVLKGFCPLCSPSNMKQESPRSISFLTNHIGIQHRYLDICWDEHLHRRYNNELDDSETPDEKENDNEIKPSKNYKSVILAFSCEICGARLSNQTSLFKHSALVHFKDDLARYISHSGICLLCPLRNKPRKYPILHVAIFHEKIQELLNNEVTILDKRNHRDTGYTFCPVCQKEGTYDFLHFSLHYSIPSHQDIIKHDSKLKKLVSQMEVYCILCGKNLRSNHFYSHYYRHFKKIIDLKKNGDSCHLCDGFPSFKSSLELEMHFKEEHFPQYLDNHFTSIQSIEDVSRLRKLFNPDSDSSSTSVSNYCSKKRKLNCDYCTEGYHEDKYYEHMSPTTFSGSAAGDLVVHSADYHKNLDRILNQICTSFNAEEVNSNANSNRVDLGSFKSTQRLHIRTITRSFIGCKRPYICPKCQYEASSYISLLRHFCTSHGHLLDQLNDEVHPSSSSSTALLSKSSNNFEDINKSRLNISVTYKEDGKDFLKKRSPIKSSKNQDFSSLISNIAKENDISLNPSPKGSSWERSSLNEPSINVSFDREPRIMTKILSSKIYPDVDHEWLCDGRLLILNDPTCSGNKKLFQDQWKRGQPVLVEILAIFDTIYDFWNGFERVQDRLKDSRGNPMLLKLKDWPPTLDIADYIPKRYNEFISSLILPEYTQREGYLNLASFIPKFFLRPELGPKMYIAYGSALYSDKGSTNLHIDMSDAVNLLVHVGMSEDGDPVENAKEVYKEVDEADCDILMKWRVRNEGRLPGALWHIYHPSDTNKIRCFLNKVALEKGKRLDPHDDPIHDQSNYLDGPLRLKLYENYGVKGYGIIQCAGDTVFIPAGACHQVRNLHNCIKIAEDFVSPENTSHCLHLTQEFRHLTDFHTNHEDKLQIKNLMYHSVKTAITVLKDHMDNPPSPSNSQKGDSLMDNNEEYLDVL
ncbi:KDM3 [Lepeophtheirus salmonis]|uniref:KDM3 n=1 Tax=Lepeophtheirus salmonis TaxID=72036 RepID=A0A7R8CXA1_LEPSM|nr:KDM3 [Lepeophtheirus salmonis]CAF2913225.1 KDM3 [Lepeophtheirus salmonis]